MVIGSAFSQTNSIAHQYVNPFVGTGGHGHTFPGPTMPYGGCQVSPDTRLSGWDGCSGYHYSDSVIYGFSHTHLSGTGCSDYGDILLMPVTHEMAIDQYQFASSFTHAMERAYGGYYQVYLNGPKVKAELTATLHGGFHQYTYSRNDKKMLVLDLKHRDELLDSRMIKVNDHTIRGYRFSKAWAGNQKVYFEMIFSLPIDKILYQPGKQSKTAADGKTDKSWQCLIQFKEEENATDVLKVKVAISGVDEDGAKKNLLKEMPANEWNFNYYQQACEKAWNDELSKVLLNDLPQEIKSEYGMKEEANEGIARHNNLMVFYTALYHCMIHPSIYSDVDGRYRGRDDKIHNTNGAFDYYTVFSLWDTYRGLHPLLTILDKKRSNDFIATFVKEYEEGGRLPIWKLSSNETNCMIGYHVVSVIWDCYNKGIRHYDVEKAYEAMTKIATHFSDYDGSGLNLTLKKSARSRSADADALESYNRFGYVRADDAAESVSKTLEFAYDDWCIAQMAKALGKKDDYAYYLKRSNYWTHVYDPITGFMRARKNGCLYSPFSPYTVDVNYTEANSWQYSLYTPHAIENFIALQHGNKEYEKKLDNLFHAKTETEGREQADITGLIGQYAHGNEPSHHIAFLYDYIGESQKTKDQVDYIMKNFYTNSPDGLIGNEDCGQMSAWYVLAAMGVYPVCPGQRDFELFDFARFKSFQLKDGAYKTFYGTKSTTTKNKVEVTTNHLLALFHDMEQEEEPLVYDSIRNRIEDLPGNPFIANGQSVFDGQMDVIMSSPQPENKILYRLNKGVEKVYNKPFRIQSNSKFEFYSINKNKVKSSVQRASFTTLPYDRKIILKNVYNKSYNAGGASGMMDGIYGKLNWRAGDWQGYQGEDVTMICALKEKRKLTRLAANVLEDQNAWIFYPKEVSFYVSNDSIHWTLVETIPTHKSGHELEVTISKFEAKSSLQKLKEAYQFVKLEMKNFGPMPEWHEGRGNPTFIFVDEFEVE